MTAHDVSRRRYWRRSAMAPKLCTYSWAGAEAASSGTGDLCRQATGERGGNRGFLEASLMRGPGQQKMNFRRSFPFHNP
ncbi:hypothetical protein HPB48_023280 [Haemaphysalis longicornis]|uniref:Uncharacterized protein n=1 Tax=Haemaphysalis longicornis TaxID=44386 RepID=A0A9J6H5X4_HAELO|nr:hypothetical protein HPB48_023280 [Haemaphysalis longicornis]